METNWSPYHIIPRLSVHVLLRTCTSHPLEHSTHFDIQEEQSLLTYIHTPKQTQSQQSKYNRRINQPRRRAEKTRQAPHTQTQTQPQPQRPVNEDGTSQTPFTTSVCISLQRRVCHAAHDSNSRNLRCSIPRALTH